MVGWVGAVGGGGGVWWLGGRRDDGEAGRKGREVGRGMRGSRWCWWCGGGLVVRARVDVGMERVGKAWRGRWG